MLCCPKSNYDGYINFMSNSTSRTVSQRKVADSVVSISLNLLEYTAEVHETIRLKCTENTGFTLSCGLLRDEPEEMDAVRN